MSLFVVSFFSFIAAASVIMMIVMVVTAAKTSPQARIEKRLLAIGNSPNASREEIQDLLKSSSYSEIDWIDGFLSNLNFVRSIDLLLERANMDMSVGLFFLTSLFPAAITFLTLTQLGQPLIVGLLVAAVASLVPFFYAKYRVRKRLRRFLEQMPDGLDAVRQGLEAGMGLAQALGLIAKDMPDPFGTEFSIFLEELNLGLPLDNALKNLQERVPLAEVRLFNNALVVQREAGGSLAELVTKLGDVIRDRFRIEREIRTLTAQNRLSAWVVSSMPVFLALFMYLTDPAMIYQALDHPVGRTMMITAIVLEILGILAFRKIIRIHI